MIIATFHWIDGTFPGITPEILTGSNDKWW